MDALFARLGWDLDLSAALEDPARIVLSNEDLKKLAKCAYSMKLFGYDEEYKSVLKFVKTSGIDLSSNGCDWFLKDPTVFVREDPIRFANMEFLVFKEKQDVFESIQHDFLSPSKNPSVKDGEAVFVEEVSVGLKP
jgi:hypothetical protein